MVSLVLESQKGAQRQRSPGAPPPETSAQQQLFVHRLEKRQRSQAAPRADARSLIHLEHDDESRVIAIREAFRALSRNTEWDAGESRQTVPTPKLASDPRPKVASESVRKRLPIAKSATQSRPFYQLARMPPLSAPEACGKKLTSAAAAVRLRDTNATPPTPIARLGVQGRRGPGASRAHLTSPHATEERKHTDTRHHVPADSDIRAIAATRATRLRMTKSSEPRRRRSLAEELSPVEERIAQFEQEVRRMEYFQWGLAGGAVESVGRTSRMRGAHTLADIRSRFSRLPVIREEIDFPINAH